MSSSTPSPATVLEVFDTLGPPGTPMTTPEVADEFDCTDRTIYNKLDALVEEGVLETKKVGARGRVWWQPIRELEHRANQGNDSHRATESGVRSDGLPIALDSGSEMGKCIREQDWAETPLGPIDDWPQELRVTVDIMLGASEAIGVYWGSDLHLLYNDAWRELIGDKHPDALGQPAREVFPETWETIGPMFERVMSGAGAQEGREQLLPLGRDEGTENVWFDYRANPIPMADGSVGGIFNIALEITERKEVQEELRKAKEQLEVTTNAASVGIWIWDFETDIVTADTLLAEMFAIDPQTAAAGAPIDDFITSIREEDQDRVWHALNEAVEETDEFEAEYRVEGTNGENRWVIARGEVEYDANGNQVRMNGALLDITERKRREEQLRKQAELDAFRIALTDELHPIDDPVEIQHEAAHVIGELLDVDRALYGKVLADGDTNIVHADYYRGDVSSVVGKYHLDDYGEYVTDKFQGGETVVIDDVTTVSNLSDEEQTAYLETEISAWMGVPLIKSDQLTAYFVVNQSSPREWTDTEVAMVEETAERTWDAVQRARAEQELHQSEERFRTLANLVPSLLWSNDESGSATWQNQQWYDYTGQTPEEATDYGWLDVIHPDDRDQSRQNFQNAVDAGEPLRQEHRIRRYDGESRWFLMRTRPLKDDKGNVLRWFGAATDVHEARVATAAIERLNTATQELIDADAETISDHVAKHTLDILGVEYAALWRYDGTAGELREHASETGPRTNPDAVRLPDELSDHVWQTFIGDDIEVDNDLDVPENASSALPLQSHVLVPLGKHGVICAGSTQTGTFDERMVDIMGTIATTVKTEWDRAESEEELARQNEELERLERRYALLWQIDQALVEAETVEAIDEAVCDQLTDSEFYEFAWIGEFDADTDTIAPRTWSGIANNYLDKLITAIDESVSDRNPFATALRTGEMQIIADIATDARATTWREITLKHGARSCLSIPLVYHESVYGVLTVYGGSPLHDERDTDVLVELGQTTAHAIHAVSTRETLQTDRVVELTLRSTAAETPLCRIARETGCVIEFEGLVPGADGDTTVFFTATGVSPEELVAAGEQSISIEKLICLTDGDEEALFKTRLADPMTISRFLEQDAVVRSLTIDAGTVTAVIDLPETGDVREFVERSQRDDPDLDLLAKQTQTRSLETEHTLLTTVEDRLTSRQQEVLHLAYQSGFFESPRVQTGKELSEALDISQSTFTQHLREAQRRLCALVFENS